MKHAFPRCGSWASKSRIRLNGKRFERELDYYADWFNDYSIAWINEVLAQEGFGGRLHGFSDGMQGLILLYGDDAFLQKVNAVIPETYNLPV